MTSAENQVTQESISNTLDLSQKAEDHRKVSVMNFKKQYATEHTHVPTQS